MPVVQLQRLVGELQGDVELFVRQVGRGAEAEVVVSERIERRQPPRLVDGCDGFGALVAECVQRAVKQVRKRRAGVRLERQLEPALGDVEPLVEVVLDQPFDGQAEGVVRRQVKRPRGGVDAKLLVGPGIDAPAVEDAQDIPFREPCVGFRGMGRPPDGLFDQLPRPRQIGERRAGHQSDAGDHQPMVLDIRELASGDMGERLVGDGRTDGADQSRDALGRGLEIGVDACRELARPENAPGWHVEEIGIEDEVRTGAMQCAGDAVIGMQGGPDARRVRPPDRQLPAGQMRDHRDQPRPAQGPAHFLREPVADCRVHRIAADGAERQDGDVGQDRDMAARAEAEHALELRRVLPDAGEPLREPRLADLQSLEKLPFARAADEIDAREVQRDVGVRAGQHLAEGVAHQGLDVGQRATEALSAGVVAGDAPERLLQE